ncbi:MAG: radical SAM protein [Planctomycetes bacterium]|nr:radical SAM protein [Planctomycetota bacterium]
MSVASKSERLKPLEALKGREKTHLLIAEIYASIQGESTHAGRPCVFVRTTACNLRCQYCDTAWAFTEGKVMAFDDVLKQALGYGVPLVEITGGEPLLQPLIPKLCQKLLDAGCEVLVETSGALDISPLPQGTKTILDIKTPTSGEDKANDYNNLRRLRPGDEVKFVLCNRADYEWARDLIKREKLHERTTVLLSCAFRQLEPSQLVTWMIEDKLPTRLNVQLHKFVWPPAQRGV